MHRLRVFFILGLTSLALAGCELGARFDSPDERINAAVPLAIDLRQARERLNEQLAVTKADRASLDSAWFARLRARATSCSPDFTPNWRQSSDEVRAAVRNEACFADFDRKLARWIGAQRVRLLLAEPPAALGTVPASVTVQGQLAATSPNSAVAAFNSADGFELVSLDGGRSLFKERSAGGVLGLSPNGRLFVQTLSGGVSRIRAVEGGETLLELSDARSVQWLGSWFLGVRSAGNKPAYLFSLNSAEEAPVTANTFGSYSNDALLPVPGGTNRFNFLTFQGLYQFEAQETGGKFGITAVIEKPGVQQSLMPISTGVGRLTGDGGTWVLESGGALVRLNLTTLEMQQSSFQPLYVDGAIPTAKQDKFVLQLRAPMEAASPGSRSQYLYDAAAGTLAKVEGADAERPLVYLAGVKRLARLSPPTVWLLDEPETAAPLLVADVQNAQLEEVNQAKLNKLRLEDLRIAGSPALQAGSPLLPSVRDAQVEGIGIYEATEKIAQPGQSRSIGRVTVTVRRSPQPTVLVLCSYEAVQWNLKLEPGARLGAVLVGGYYDSSVQGAGDARVLKIGRQYAYQQDGPEFVALQREVSRWTGRPISLFQTGYHGHSYTVGGR